jgi:hypothetical protein
MTEAELDQLAMKAELADDNEYLEMTDEEFHEFVTEDLGLESGDPMLEILERQRDLGFADYQNEVAAELAGITDPAALHYLISDYDYDSSDWLLRQIINNPTCDIRTARHIFWHLAPAAAFAEYGQPVGEEILAVIDRKARAVDGGFVHKLPKEYESAENKIFAGEGDVWPLPSSLEVVGE